jgi:hypothetical protein
MVCAVTDDYLLSIIFEDELIQVRREKFNSQFSRAAYDQFLQGLRQQLRVPIEFHVSETPVFVPDDLLVKLQKSADQIIHQMLAPSYIEESARSIPASFNAPSETSHPTFIQVDFAITRDAQNNLVPRLIELQGCASVHALQLILSQGYASNFDLSGLKYLLSNLNDGSYIELLKRAVVNRHEPEQVILMEIDPETQKTLPDFAATEQLLGVRTINIRDIFKRGRKLFYRHYGREIEIRRIYNRVIIDELVEKGVEINFDYRDDLNVEWAGHPNWFFRMSKFSLPYLHHPSIPRSWFISQLSATPNDLENFVLKPLFSFAGSGVKVDVTQADIDAIPESERSNYLLQEKITYAPVIVTPDEPSKVEIRVMYIWPDEDEKPTPAMLLGRLSKGKMMGVSFNKHKTWVGSSACFFE